MKREYILDKAEELFAQKGYEATTIRDIASHAQINLAMVSYYFGSKEKLLVQLFTRKQETAFVLVNAIAKNKHLNCIEKLDMFIDTYVDRIKNERNFFYVLIAEQVTNKNKGIIQFFDKSKQAFLLLYEHVITEGYETKKFKNKIDPVLLMATITGTLIQSLFFFQTYKTYHSLKSSKKDLENKYFYDLKKHLKTMVKSLLGYAK